MSEKKYSIPLFNSVIQSTLSSSAILVYGWLLLNVIIFNKKYFTISQIINDLHISKLSVSRGLKELTDSKLFINDEYDGYILYNFYKNYFHTVSAEDLKKEVYNSNSYGLFTSIPVDFFYNTEFSVKQKVFIIKMKSFEYSFLTGSLRSVSVICSILKTDRKVFYNNLKKCSKYIHFDSTRTGISNLKVSFTPVEKIDNRINQVKEIKPEQLATVKTAEEEIKIMEKIISDDLLKQIEVEAEKQTIEPVEVEAEKQTIEPEITDDLLEQNEAEITDDLLEQIEAEAEKQIIEPVKPVKPVKPVEKTEQKKDDSYAQQIEEWKRQIEAEKQIKKPVEDNKSVLQQFQNSVSDCPEKPVIDKSVSPVKEMIEKSKKIKKDELLEEGDPEITTDLISLFGADGKAKEETKAVKLNNPKREDFKQAEEQTIEPIKQPVKKQNIPNGESIQNIVKGIEAGIYSSDQLKEYFAKAV